MSKVLEKTPISVFGKKVKEALLVPEIPIAVRCNCQSGQWTIGDTDYGSKCSMTILKFNRFFGSLGQTSHTVWGQVWFVAESGELPQGVVMVTYIKTRTLNDFNRCVTSVQARGVEPATGIFVPEFVKHSSNKPDDNGVLKPINYYSLKWSWVERTDWSILEQATVVLNDPSNLSRMIDLEGTRNLICLENLSPQDIACLLSTQNQTVDSTNVTPELISVHSQPELGSRIPNSLPASLNTLESTAA